MNIAVLPGDGIGPEIVAEAVRVLEALRSDGLSLEFEYAPVGAAAYEVSGEPLPAATLDLAARADAVLFGAVGDARQDALPRALRPEQAILGLRKALGLYTNLRPAKVHDALVEASPLKAERVRGVDLMIVRELNGDIYFGQPKGRGVNADGADEGFDTMRYSAPEVERVARRAFTLARARRKRVCSVDKSNVLESMQLWRDVVTYVGRDYPDVDLTHMYVDNAAMQLVHAPLQFDVLLTGNMFGDILSDEASMITGSIGLLPSAALGDGQRGLYEPIHGSAPDIAGRGIANPIGTILSAALMLRYSGGFEAEAARIERAVQRVLDDGLRTVDLARPGTTSVGTSAIGAAVVAAL